MMDVVLCVPDKAHGLQQWSIVRPAVGECNLPSGMTGGIPLRGTSAPPPSPKLPGTGRAD